MEKYTRHDMHLSDQRKGYNICGRYTLFLRSPIDFKGKNTTFTQSSKKEKHFLLKDSCCVRAVVGGVAEKTKGKAIEFQFQKKRTVNHSAFYEVRGQVMLHLGSNVT